MTNKPRKIPHELLEEVYTALGLVLLQQPTGAGPTDVWEALFKDSRDCTSISRAICELERRGYVIFVEWRDKRKKYCLTDKEFKLSPAMALNGSSTSRTGCLMWCDKEQVKEALNLFEQGIAVPNKAVFTAIPERCSFCAHHALVNGKTTRIGWANMCLAHFIQVGIGIGLGKGLVLIWKKGKKK
jgi:hypothetical protein